MGKRCSKKGRKPTKIVPATTDLRLTCRLSAMEFADIMRNQPRVILRRCDDNPNNDEGINHRERTEMIIRVEDAGGNPEGNSIAHGANAENQKDLCSGDKEDQKQLMDDLGHYLDDYDLHLAVAIRNLKAGTQVERSSYKWKCCVYWDPQISKKLMIHRQENCKMYGKLGIGKILCRNLWEIDNCFNWKNPFVLVEVVRLVRINNSGTFVIEVVEIATERTCNVSYADRFFSLEVSKQCSNLALEMVRCTSTVMLWGSRSYKNAVHVAGQDPFGTMMLDLKTNDVSVIIFHNDAISDARATLIKDNISASELGDLTKSCNVTLKHSDNCTIAVFVSERLDTNIRDTTQILLSSMYDASSDVGGRIAQTSDVKSTQDFIESDRNDNMDFDGDADLEMAEPNSLAAISDAPPVALGRDSAGKNNARSVKARSNDNIYEQAWSKSMQYDGAIALENSNVHNVCDANLTLTDDGNEGIDAVECGDKSQIGADKMDCCDAEPRADVSILDDVNDIHSGTESKKLSSHLTPEVDDDRKNHETYDRQNAPTSNLQEEPVEGSQIEDVHAYSFI